MIEACEEEAAPRPLAFCSTTVRSSDLREVYRTPGPAYYEVIPKDRSVSLGDPSFRSQLHRLDGLKSTNEAASSRCAPGPKDADAERGRWPVVCGTYQGPSAKVAVYSASEGATHCVPPTHEEPFVIAWGIDSFAFARTRVHLDRHRLHSSPCEEAQDAGQSVPAQLCLCIRHRKAK